jgi:demethylmenaquinone methyltransferase/2-methoxy-6-polyprenyl-1,4-benzoquinol methylase
MPFPLKARDYLDDPERKRVYNRALFREIAPRYDFITRALSLGRDRAWKRALVRALPDQPSPRCLDLATGTGDLALLLARRYPAGHVLGIDLTRDMVDRAHAAAGEPNVQFAQGDMGALDQPDGSFDVVTGGYALRNAPDLGVALAEVHRVLAPDGTAAFLEFSRPDQPFAGRLELGLLSLWGGFWGWLVHGTPEVYTYIAESLRRFPSRREFAALVARHGFAIRHRRRFMAGIVELTVLEKTG